MKVTLRRVANKAMADQAFWKKLRAYPDQTLLANKMELSKADYKRLTAILGLHGKTITMDLDKLMALARRRHRMGDSLTWRGIWDPPTFPPAPGPPKPVS